MTKNQENIVTISVASDFSRFPSGRTPEDSKYSGQAFREKFLVGPLSAGQQVVVQLDGAIGYGSSFLDEAFGGLVRDCGLAVSAVKALLRLESHDPTLPEEIWSYIEQM